jgi:hypothetical protein
VPKDAGIETRINTGMGDILRPSDWADATIKIHPIPRRPEGVRVPIDSPWAAVARRCTKILSTFGVVRGPSVLAASVSLSINPGNPQAAWKGS